MRTRRLIVVTPEGDRELLFIGRLTIGRAPECDISLADTKISRRHAEFDASGPMPRVTDLGSRNGILVNGRKAGAADLVPGDVVTVGDARIRFEERTVDVPAPAASTSEDERTTILPPIMAPAAGALPGASVPAPPAPPPPRAAKSPLAELIDVAGATPLAELLDVAGLGEYSNSEKTTVLPPRAPAASPPTPVLSPADPPTERTVLLPPPQRPAAAAAMPVAPSPEAGAADEESALDAAPPVAPPQRPPVKSVPPPMPSTPAAPAAVPAATPVTGAASATGSSLKGPRFSWDGLITLAAVLLGGLAVLLGALPLMSASSSALDALSQRQARTLAGWLAAGVNPQASTVVDPRVMEAVLTQPGVARAMVLERATGRALAPASLGGRAYSALPGLGEAWRELTEARVGRVDAFADAYVPAGDGAYVAWVRYERPSSDDTGLAIMVALVATLVFAMLMALLIKRHTRATLQHFTRQVELAVSGASPKVMQGTLMPGLDRLPGVVTYLLEQRRAGGAKPSGRHAPGLLDTDDPALASVAAPQIDPGPPWIEVTPSLMVAEVSAHGPDASAPGWSNARGRHLLDVLDNGPMRNAVVQGLGALGMQSGSEATVPLPGAAPIALRRESSGNVRVTLGAR